MAKTQQEETVKTQKGIELKVAGGSNAAKVAGALVSYMKEGNAVSLIAMGAGAVNQAVKSICIARGMCAPQGVNLSCVPGFADENVGGVKKTAIRFTIIKG